MIVKQTGVFKRTVKKLHNNEKQALDRAVRKIMDDPGIGQMKTGDLSGVQVHKFKVLTDQYLLAYQLGKSGKDQVLTLLALGSHENFYRDLKKR